MACLLAFTGAGARGGVREEEEEEKKKEGKASKWVWEGVKESPGKETLVRSFFFVVVVIVFFVVFVYVIFFLAVVVVVVVVAVVVVIVVVVVFPISCTCGVGRLDGGSL